MEKTFVKVDETTVRVTAIEDVPLAVISEQFKTRIAATQLRLTQLIENRDVLLPAEIAATEKLLASEQSLSDSFDVVAAIDTVVIP